MYLRGKQEVPNPDPQSGLYIRDRHNNIVKVTLPPNNIAFQVRWLTPVGVSRGIPCEVVSSTHEAVS